MSAFAHTSRRAGGEMYRSSWALVALLLLVGAVGADSLLAFKSGKAVPIFRRTASFVSILLGVWLVNHSRQGVHDDDTIASAAPPLPPPREQVSTPDIRSGQVAYLEGTVCLAVFALLLTLFSVSYTLWRNPPWGRLASYDFRTPEAALRSYIRMDATCDVVAERELRSKFEQNELKKFRESFEFKHTREFDEKQAAFVRWERTDSRQGGTRETRLVFWFEKDKASGYWIFGHQPERLSETNKKLAAEIKAWEKSGLLDRTE